MPEVYRYFDTDDIAGLIAPRPLLLEMGIYDNCFFIQDTLKGYEGVKRIYEAAGAADKPVGRHLPRPARLRRQQGLRVLPAVPVSLSLTSGLLLYTLWPEQLQHLRRDLRFPGACEVAQSGRIQLGMDGVRRGNREGRRQGCQLVRLHEDRPAASPAIIPAR